jgi:hypothetical protein
MRTLSRPMFNWGGPVKQGVMHGIREPYRGGGQAAGRAALVGNPLYPRTGGREHHIAPILGIGAINAARWLATLGVRQGLKKVAQKGAGQTFKNIGASYGLGGLKVGSAGAGSAGSAAAAPVYTGMKGYFMRDPAVKAALWAKNAIFNPTTAGWGKSLARGLVSPSSLGLIGYGGYQYLKGDKGDPTVTGVEKPGGYPGAVVGEKAKSLTDAERKAFALAQRSERVKKYLDMMGYDRSKKTAIADALIDASKIVSDRGTLDPKNITQELINPIIQAASKRLDKPEQIREAVGLMMTKAGLEKEMYDAKPGTIAKNVEDMVKSGQYTKEEAWAIATKGSQGAVADIQGAIATGKLTAASWPSFLRATGKLHDLPVTVVTEEQIKGIPELEGKTDLEIVTERQKGDGLYMIGQSIFQVEGGTPTQIV